MFPLCESCRKQVSWNVSHPLAQIIISFLSAPMTLHRHTHSYDATLAWNEHWRQRSGWAGSVCVYDFLLTVSGYVISDCKLPALVYCHCGGVTYSYVTRICFVCHDSVSSTNHMSSDLYFFIWATSICAPKSDTDLIPADVAAVWTVGSEFIGGVFLPLSMLTSLSQHYSPTVSVSSCR